MGPWQHVVSFLGATPPVAWLLVAVSAGSAFGAHVWRLRHRERHLAILVNERTRLWQEEAASRSQLVALLGPRLEAGTDGSPDTSTVNRVLVVAERRDRLAEMQAAFDGLGITPAFADSRWAANVAAHLADAEGAPYDLILIDAALEGSEPAPIRAGAPGWVSCEALPTVGGGR